MKSIRKSILQCIYDFAGNDLELIAALERIAGQKGRQVYSVIIDVLTDLDVSHQQAEAHWRQVVTHGKHLSNLIGRNVRLQTAMIDYFSSIDNSLKHPKIVEINRYEKTAMLSKYDSLTGLLNRHSFEELFAREISRAERHDKELSVLFFDLDNFKRINDYYGHIAGDMALKRVAEIILEEKRDEDIAARYGGEEIVVILPETGKVNTLTVGERIRERIESLTLEHHGQKINLTISGGLASYPYDATDASNLLNDADAALRQAKSFGKNTIVLFSTDKRRYARRPFIHDIKMKEVTFNGSEIDTVRSADLSVNGIRLQSKRALEVGAKLQLQIPLKNGIAPRLIVGAIKNVTPQNASHFEIGVSFLQVDYATRLDILSYLLSNPEMKSHKVSIASAN